jgi:uncharacterized protein YqeY
MSDAAETLKARLRKALKTAMKARRIEEGKLHRVIFAAVDNPDLSAEDLLSLLENEIIAWRAAAAEYERLGHPEEAARLHAEAQMVLSYLAG